MLHLLLLLLELEVLLVEILVLLLGRLQRLLLTALATRHLQKKSFDGIGEEKHKRIISTLVNA